jgi:5-methylcytosine-specific restriction endonuclease McrA
MQAVPADVQRKGVMREHRTTHPILGPSTWREMREAASTIRRETSKRVCVWCHQEIPKGRRTRCGKEECNEGIYCAWSWGHCRHLALWENYHLKKCQCGKPAAEADHIVPVSLGGTGDQDNLRPLCRACHKAETARLRRDKREYTAAFLERAL